MSNKELSKHLIKRIILNLGFFVNDGLFNPINKIQKKLRLEEEDGSINEYEIYGAECNAGPSKIDAVVVDIGLLIKDLVIAIIQENVVIAIRYTENNDSAFFMIREGEKWVDMSILYQLNLAAGIEMITQGGFIWTPTSDQESLYAVIASILSEE